MPEGTSLSSCFVCDYDLCMSCVATSEKTSSTAKKSALPKKSSGSAAASGDIKKNVFDKKVGRVIPSVHTKKVYSKDELSKMRRQDLRDLCKKAGLVQSGSDADIVERLVSKYEEISTPADDAVTMDSDVYYAFAFCGFPQDTNELEAVHLIKEYVHDYLGQFSVTVIGSSAVKGQIAMTFLASEGEALLAKVHEHRDRFVYHGTVLTTIAVDNLELGAFKMPDPTPHAHAAPRRSRAPVDVRGAETETFYTSTPVRATQRSATVHSGLTPDLALAGQTLEDFLTLEPEAKPLIAPPMPGQTVDPTMQAILDGVNEIRATAVTRATLREFQQLQSEEMRTFVRAETAPLHNAVGQLSQEVVQLRTRVVQVEQREPDSGPGGFKKDKFDPAFQEVSFIDFPEKILHSEKLRHIDEFMKKHFGDLQCVYTGCNSAKAYFVHMDTPRSAKKVLETVKSRSLKLDVPGVKILPALTAIDRSRNWALGTAKELVEKDKRAQGKSVDVKKAKGRGIYVNNEAVFLQEHRYDPRGSFVGGWSDLQLPS